MYENAHEFLPRKTPRLVNKPKLTAKQEKLLKLKQLYGIIPIKLTDEEVEDSDEDEQDMYVKYQKMSAKVERLVSQGKPELISTDLQDGQDELDELLEWTNQLEVIDDEF